jgi:hypothetical protein
MGTITKKRERIASSSTEDDNAKRKAANDDTYQSSVMAELKNRERGNKKPAK